MSTYVAKIEHTPADCPGTSKENLQRVQQAMGKMEPTGKELGVEVSAIHVLLPSHEGVIILEAPDYETASRFLQLIGIDMWNDVRVYRSTTPQEAIASYAERFGS